MHRRSPEIEMRVITKEQEKKDSGIRALDPGFKKWAFLFHGFPKNTPLELSMKRVCQKDLKKFTVIRQFYLTKEGQLKERGTKRPTIQCFSIRGMCPGEAIVFRFATLDNKVEKERKIIPLPIEVKKSGKVLISAELVYLDQSLTNYTIRVKNIGKNEVFTLTSKSNGEIIKHRLKGPTTLMLSPNVIGAYGGVADVEFVFSKGSRYSIKLPWGNEMLKYASR